MCSEAERDDLDMVRGCKADTRFYEILSCRLSGRGLNGTCRMPTHVPPEPEPQQAVGVLFGQERRKEVGFACFVAPRLLHVRFTGLSLSHGCLLSV